MTVELLGFRVQREDGKASEDKNRMPNDSNDHLAIMEQYVMEMGM